MIIEQTNSCGLGRHNTGYWSYQAKLLRTQKGFNMLWRGTTGLFGRLLKLVRNRSNDTIVPTNEMNRTAEALVANIRSTITSMQLPQTAIRQLEIPKEMYKADTFFLISTQGYEEGRLSWYAAGFSNPKRSYGLDLKTLFQMASRLRVSTQLAFVRFLQTIRPTQTKVCKGWQCSNPKRTHNRRG